jgi:S1-C subfamily serine protease
LGGGFPNRRRKFEGKLALILVGLFPLPSRRGHVLALIVHQKRTKFALGWSLLQVKVHQECTKTDSISRILCPGDIVLSVNEKRVQDIRQFALALYPFAVGEKATLKIQRGKQTMTYQIPVREKQDVQERLADLVTMEEARIPQLGILALTLDERLVSMLPPLRNRFGVVVAGKVSYGAYEGEGPLPGDVIYSVNGTLVDSIDSLRAALDDLKTADAIALQVERLGSLHYLVLEADR